MRKNHSVRTRMTVGRDRLMSAVITAEKNGATAVDISREHSEAARKLSIASLLVMAHALAIPDSPLEKAIWEAILVDDPTARVTPPTTEPENKDWLADGDDIPF